MRELTVRIRFTEHCLGNVKDKTHNGSCFALPRSPSGKIIFLASWHQANLRFAAQLLGRHQAEVEKIRWDIQVDGSVEREGWFRRHYRISGSGKSRYCLHEAFVPDQVIGINCVVPSGISDDDFWRLLDLAGRYCGLSPWKPREYGFFAVESIRPRLMPGSDDQINEVNTEIVPVEDLHSVDE